MAENRLRTPLPERLTSRRGAWISLGLVLTIMVVLFGVFGSAKAPALNDQAPAGSESSRVSELMQKFPNTEEQSVLVVASREDGAAFSQAGGGSARDACRPLPPSALQRQQGRTRQPQHGAQYRQAHDIAPLAAGAV